MEKYFVYRMTSPKGKHYIGITNNLERRMQEHIKVVNYTDPNVSNRKLTNAFRKYGFENMNFEHIFTAFSLDDAKEVEILLVKHYDSYNNGYNMTLGGDYYPSIKYSDEELDALVEDLKEGVLSYTDLSKKHSMSPAFISNVRNGKTFRRKYGAIERENVSMEGSNNPFSKLNEDKVKEIFELLKSGMNQVDIAKKFGIVKGLISEIARRKVWTHVETDYVYAPKKNKLSDEDVEQIIEWANSRTYMRKEMAEMFGVSKALIDKVLRGKIRSK